MKSSCWNMKKEKLERESKLNKRYRRGDQNKPYGESFCKIWSSDGKFNDTLHCAQKNFLDPWNPDWKIWHFPIKQLHIKEPWPEWLKRICRMSNRPEWPKLKPKAELFWKAENLWPNDLLSTGFLRWSQYVSYCILNFQRRPRPKAAGPLSTNHQLLFRRSHSSILPLLPLENWPC